MKAFMLRHQEELHAYEIQMGFLPHMALNHFHTSNWEMSPTAKPHHEKKDPFTDWSLKN